MRDFDLTCFTNFDGNFCSNQIPVGYCNYCKHSGYITKAEMDTHNCLSKKCLLFEKNLNHPIFVDEENMKQKKLNEIKDNMDALGMSQEEFDRLKETNNKKKILKVHSSITNKNDDIIRKFRERVAWQYHEGKINFNRYRYLIRFNDVDKMLSYINYEFTKENYNKNSGAKSDLTILQKIKQILYDLLYANDNHDYGNK